ncbi:MAG: endonuclease III domain-containing protein [Candidatus Hydrogenedentes bacterium]|nr:endonuclease III domain-containing protein [Candidatus Hydrogenedentota bacterium]
MSSTLRQMFSEIYDRLQTHFGPTHWWPGDTPFEIAVGAILVQNTAWVNVEKAIRNLKAADMLYPTSILHADEAALQKLLRPSGFFRVKSVRLRNFCRYFVERYDGDFERMAERSLEELRAELLQVPGIGPETADDILLYACNKPVFVVDAYTRRMLSRHGLAKSAMPYEELRALFERNLDSDLHMFKEYHGLIVSAGKDFCRRAPKCELCPLGPMLKNGRPKQ